MYGEGRLGVDIFFVLSGMLMSNILFVKRMNLRDFYVRRIARILPAFVLFVATMFSISEFLGWEFKSSEFWGTLTFVRTYFPSSPAIWDESPVPVGHLWSLNVEEHAYMILSILTLFLVRSISAAVVLLTVGMLSVATCFYYFFNTDDPQEVHFISTETAACFIFISAGYNLIKHKTDHLVSPIMPVIAFGLAMICYSLYLPRWFSFSFAPILLAFAVNHLTILSRVFKKMLCFAPLRYMGIWSFSIYLWQQPFYEYKSVIPGPGFLLPLLLSLTCGLLSFYYFENPLRTRINRHWDNIKVVNKPTISTKS